VVRCLTSTKDWTAPSEAFEEFARAWIRLVNERDGTHHGYFLPAEGASDRAIACFSFESRADYEVFREGFGVDPEFIAADRIRDESGCVLRWERTFMRPVLGRRFSVPHDDGTGSISRARPARLPAVLTAADATHPVDCPRLRAPANAAQRPPAVRNGSGS
jgi:hypothetical protein